MQSNEQTFDATKFHNNFDNALGELLEGPREVLMDYGEEPTVEQIIAQIIMDFVGNPDGMDADDKVRLVKVADHMGPDYAQALYHAAVFITKVA